MDVRGICMCYSWFRGMPCNADQLYARTSICGLLKVYSSQKNELAKTILAV